MSFSNFSKSFTANMFTSVENQFITKYLPQADGDAVRVYLFGLYLCQCTEEFDAASTAKLLRISLERLIEIYDFWEECDLVHILSRDPLFVEYLPVNASIGKPKPVKAEKYAAFNRELYKLLQKSGTEFKPYEMQKILEFLENNPMEQQAFLLVAEYCAKKDGEKLSCSHILNKAAKMCRERKYTLEQAERELADFNEHERDLSKIFSYLGIYRKVQESDYEYLDKWLNAGIESGAILSAAKSLKKGSLSTLSALLEELADKNIFKAKDAEVYLAKREELTATVFAVAKRLGVKVQNPRPYAEEYVEKWLERGYDTASLSLVAAFCMKLGYGFGEMDALLDTLYHGGTVDEESVKAYCSARDKDFRLLQSLQAECGVLKKTQSALDMVAAWKSWNFSDAMIKEAAKRSANASAPLPYMNKLLSEWKREGIFTPSSIPENAPHKAPAYQSEAAIAADLRGSRERYYAALHEKALDRAEKMRKKAAQNEEFRKAESEMKECEIALARAEVYDSEKLPSLRQTLEEIKERRIKALQAVGIQESDLLPNYVCKKCSDTGFMKDGRMCDCYRLTE
ncbi:MAG: DnaD domain protein [Clostridia bacterium]|nr:DnaD domain protein [Clostridia bacterium]